MGSRSSSPQDEVYFVSGSAAGDPKHSRQLGFYPQLEIS